MEKSKLPQYETPVITTYIDDELLNILGPAAFASARPVRPEDME